MEPPKLSASPPRFDRLLEAEIPKLRRYARSLTRGSSHGDADDLLQSTLIRAWRKQHLFRVGTNLQAWLFTIMHNQRAEDVRYSSRRGEQVGMGPLLKGIIDDRMDSSAGVILRDLVKALEKLTPEKRRVIGLIGYYGLSYDEAAVHEGIPVGTIRSRLFRGRQELLREIRE